MEHRAHQPSLLGTEPPAHDVSPSPEVVGTAKVAIDSALPHLDRLFDYAIPANLSNRAKPGVRVRVRFGHRRSEGVIIYVKPSVTPGLKPLQAVVGDIPVLTPEISQLSQAVAAHYAGGLNDVLRLALPPRHARAEKEVLSNPPTRFTGWQGHVDDGPWSAYTAGEAFLKHLGNGASPRAVWSALPSPGKTQSPHWAQAIASATAATVMSGRTVLIIAPTTTAVGIIAEALHSANLPHLVLTAEVGPPQRYRNFLQCLLGSHPVVVGTRAAAYAPLDNLGLVVCWDEVHNAHAEPRAPYPHTRETLVMRADLTNSAVLIGGFSRSPHAQHLINTGWAHPLQAPRPVVRASTPRIHVPDEFDYAHEGGAGHARIPSFVWRRMRQGLNHGPVLVQVPRAGHAPSLACQKCHHTARCPTCAGPLLATRKTLRCQWCRAIAQDWACHVCSHTAWRARIIGVERTAEELGRGFPNVTIRQSSKDRGVIDVVESKPMLVIATPGAEPQATGGYELAIILDAHRFTDTPLLNAGVGALHAWISVASLTTKEVFILGSPLQAPAQAAVRWDPAGYAQRELTEWQSLGFPPLFTVITITGEKSDVVSFRNLLSLGPQVEVFGPVPISGKLNAPQTDELGIAVYTHSSRLLLRTPVKHHTELTEAVRTAMRVKSAKRDGHPLKVQVNAVEDL